MDGPPMSALLGACELVKVDDAEAHLSAKGGGDLVQGWQARRDVAGLEPRDGRLRGPDLLGELALAQALPLAQGADLEGESDRPSRLL